MDTLLPNKMSLGVSRWPSGWGRFEFGRGYHSHSLVISHPRDTIALWFTMIHQAGSEVTTTECVSEHAAARQRHAAAKADLTAARKRFATAKEQAALAASLMESAQELSAPAVEQVEAAEALNAFMMFRDPRSINFDA